MKFRDYQQYAIEKTLEYLTSNKEGNPLVVMPTGTGKSIVLAGIVKALMQAYPGTRILLATHVKELIAQDFDKLVKVWPSAPAGIYSAGLNRKDTAYPIVYSGIGSVVKNVAALGPRHLLLIDEAHLVNPKETTMYQKLIAGLKKTCPWLRVVGLTATPFRAKQGMLTEGDKALFDAIPVDMSKMKTFNWFISEGYLVPLTPRPTEVTFDVSGVKTSGGDYDQKQLQSVMDGDADMTLNALREVIHFGQDRHRWLIFGSGIEHAKHITELLVDLGISATCVHSKMGDHERDTKIADFKAGKYRAMVNNGVLTTGFDDPGIDLIVMLRPTRSPGLWVQMLGRGTRPFYAPGFDLDTREGRLAAIAASSKPDCLVLDFARNTERLGPINDPQPPHSKGKGSGVAPVRICENCGVYVHASLKSCPHCGFVFPVGTKIVSTASSAVLIKREEPPRFEWFTVDKVTYELHEKLGRANSLRVTYYSGLRRFSEWICLEHTGFALHKARSWWQQRSPSTEPPATTLEALEQVNGLATPTRILVWINTKYPEVRDYAFDGKRGEADTPAQSH